MQGKIALIVLAIVLVLAAGGYLAWKYWPQPGPDPTLAPDTAAMAFLEAMADEDASDMEELSDGTLEQALLEAYGAELARIRQVCGRIKVAGVISEIVAQRGNSARLEATVSFECGDSGALEFLDADLELVLVDGMWLVAGGRGPVQ